MRILLALLACCTLAAPLAAARPNSEISRIDATLDAFHHAASVADETGYFDLLAPDAVFLGTDGTERWTKNEFRAYAHPYFSQGKGWTFTPRDRHVKVSKDGTAAWFDEMLDSASYGECRGSGALQKIDGEWRIEQYNLSIPIPNGLAKEVVKRIGEEKSAQKK